jgi:alkaline phosphatase isozyme conversion protein
MRGVILMRLVRRSLLLLLAVVLCVGLITPQAFAYHDVKPNCVGAAAYGYIQKLEGKRQAGTETELAAAMKVKKWLRKAGYNVKLQPFTSKSDDTTYTSQNVVAIKRATKRPKGKPTPLVIVGAHYDASPKGMGADDNASGVGTMVEIAQRIAKYKQGYDLMFVGFGAEEAGLLGSDYFVSQMSAKDKARCVAMINFDSLIVGDKLYIHAGFNEKTGPRDAMLRIIKCRKLPIEMQPGLNPAYPAGLTPDGFSDYTAFNDAEIPIVAFESTNWEIGDLDGYVQTAQYGSFWHTDKDNLATIEQLLPGRPMVRLRAYTTLVFEYLKGLKPQVQGCGSNKKHAH